MVVFSHFCVIGLYIKPFASSHDSTVHCKVDVVSVVLQTQTPSPRSTSSPGHGTDGFDSIQLQIV
jgi:hypothetical protein